ncbi:MAG TPA: TolC family protein [Ideonella sp.]|uniref:TolC family protein n=1 Tax=Ideonella sp. TaxID=1929293 RepID=UPI002E2FAF6B|nr:TolC family protein [Ideonella sp.]HEX5683193.1 TolC family protein [Ideonella sp.]
MSLSRHLSFGPWKPCLRACGHRIARRWGALLVPPLIGVGLVGMVGQATAQGDALGSTLQGLLIHARAQSPEVGAMRQEADAAAERVQSAGALPDPILRVELMNFNNYGNGGSVNLLPSQVGETKYTLMQALPAWGKRDLRRDVADAQARQAAARTDATWAELAARIKAAYADYFKIAGNERLAREVLDLMARLERVAQARYAGGLGPQQDAIRAQLEQTAMRADLIVLESEKNQVKATLNALLAREATAPLAEPASLRPLPSLSPADATTLIERARANNPQLKVEQAGLSGAQKNRELSLRNRYPDLLVGLSPSQMGSRITTWGLMFEMNIPLQQASRRSQEREAEAMVQAARSRVENAANQLLGELAAKLAAFDSARRSEALVRSQLLPQSELSLQSALAGYENGKVDFATLLDAQRQIRKARQDLLKTQVEAQMRLAEIERLLGEDL